MYRSFKRFCGVGTGNYLYFWISKGWFDEKIAVPNASDYSINPQLRLFGTKARVEFKGSWLKQYEITYEHGKVVNFYILYEVTKNISSYWTLENYGYFVKFAWQKMLMLISINVLDMVLDLIDMDIFHTLLLELVEMW